MARKSRMCYESGYFHIMVQGIEKKYIFENKYFKEKYIEFMENSAKNNNVDIIAYCIMDNHAHYLLYCEENKNLTKIMASANTKFGKVYNKIKRRCGYVFRDRYRCENVYTEEYLRKCIRYILQNPVKAGMCIDAREYKYSKYNSDSVYRCGDEAFFYNLMLEEYEGFIDIKNEFGNLKEYEEPEQVIKRLGYVPEKCDNLPQVVKELERNCGMNKVEIAKLLNISKSKIYRAIKKQEASTRLE